MRHLLLALGVLLAAESSAFATWSVVAVDRRTGAIVIASASCVPQQAFAGLHANGLMDIQAIVAPGKGIAAAQASVDRNRQNQALIFRELQKGTAPAEIIALLRQDSAIETRQFGIVDLQGRSAGFSGARNGPTSLDVL
jgi:uncharacterized Ntn-hydrolase superfamily protein